MTLDVQNDLANRLAVLSQQMGLDDVDETLLWRHVADQPKTAQVDAIISKLLSEYGEQQPVTIIGYRYEAEMPERFYTKAALRRSLVGVRLKRSDCRGSKLQPLQAYSRDLDEYRAELDASIRHELFELWKDDVTACLREDGVNWEPPMYTDIQLKLVVEHESLRTRLSVSA
ncbi:hypothetical protein HNP46_000236 [Pseudomonas nitritireducens]|uniref:Uncharacterized protein n=1 Tax=Pseudomonas nitroreducens TaxID=46680 RepID=A0A7W7NZL6_PSENT|nr:hypothetical protein [Pseudomonas nitritireducens]MBB4861425.1 hypothetical protein [Pseudomonas nitritireducens]